jgi:hypothetical protein
MAHLRAAPIAYKIETMSVFMSLMQKPPMSIARDAPRIVVLQGRG